MSRAENSVVIRVVSNSNMNRFDCIPICSRRDDLFMCIVKIILMKYIENPVCDSARRARPLELYHPTQKALWSVYARICHCLFHSISTFFPVIWATQTQLKSMITTITITMKDEEWAVDEKPMQKILNFLLAEMDFGHNCCNERHCINWCFRFGIWTHNKPTKTTNYCIKCGHAYYYVSTLETHISHILMKTYPQKRGEWSEATKKLHFYCLHLLYGHDFRRFRKAKRKKISFTGKNVALTMPLNRIITIIILLFLWVSFILKAFLSYIVQN